MYNRSIESYTILTERELRVKGDMKKMKELKLFVGGYYDDRIFEGEEFEGKTPFSKDIETYTLSEVLKLGFVENVPSWYEDRSEKQWIDATNEERIRAIIEYTETDEIAGLLYFDTEKEAEEFKNSVIKEIEEIEKRVIYIGKREDELGYFREIYEMEKED